VETSGYIICKRRVGARRPTRGYILGVLRLMFQASIALAITSNGIDNLLRFEYSEYCKGLYSGLCVRQTQGYVQTKTVVLSVASVRMLRTDIACLMKAYV
jgi:hypothetical protein